MSRNSTMTVNPAQLLTGQTIAKVRLGRLIGEGACGVVYHGHHTTLGLDVAVKILKLTGADRDDLVYRERFRREAQLAARLDHPGLVRVLDFGEHEGCPYLVMDYVDGYSLADFLKKNEQPNDEKTVLKVVRAVAIALSVAHKACIVHRDLKPSNILVSRKGQLKITDLGLARQEGMANLTRDQVSVGTPMYMSPEAISPGGKVDHRSDLYSLGVIAYRLAFGKRPYDGTIQQIIHGHLAGLAKFDGPTQCSPETISVIKKLLATNPDQRFQSAEELVNTLQQKLLMRMVGPANPGPQLPGQSEASTGSSVSVTRTSDFRGMVNLLEGRLGASTSDRNGEKIVHTTAKERLLVWVVLVGVLLVAGMGYVFFSGQQP